MTTTDPDTWPGSTCADHTNPEPVSQETWQAWATDNLDMYRCEQCGHWRLWRKKTERNRHPAR
jgi:Zn ribbon nucleic-acid-binding protein